MASSQVVTSEHPVIPATVNVETPPRPIRTVLLLGSSLSGATRSLMKELRARGVKVYWDHPSLRRLRRRPLFLAAMAAEAFFTYGLRFRQYLLRTRASNWAFGFASERTLDSYGNIDMVVQIGANHAPFSTHRRPGVVYVVYTDHSNLLSKQIPDFGLHMPERHVSSTWNELERKNLSLQHHVFVMGSQVERSMVQDYRLPPDHVSTVGAGPNLEVDIVRDGFEKDSAGKNVLFVGLQPERKGLPALIEAFAQVRQSHPEGKLHVVGVNGTSANGVIYYGALRGDALKQRYYEAQVFAMPTLREPFGMVFVEAMWSKAVCVGTRIGAIPDIIADGESGYVVEPNDVNALAARITRLFDDPKLRTAFADRAYAEAKRRFSWPSVVNQILDTVNRLSI
jgi:alpha-maltose-1-phosphate synthase